MILLTDEPDSHDYPRDHTYLVFATSENCPAAINSALENAVSLFAGLTIYEMLSTVTNVIINAMIDPDSEPSTSGESDVPDFNECTSTISNSESYWEPDEEEDMFGPIQSETELQAKIRRDLRVVKSAGFRLGYLGSNNSTIIVSVSCRIARLGISDEAMDAWGVKPSEYLVLLIRYMPTYVDLQRILEIAGDAKRNWVQMHVGLCDSYKPSLQHAIDIFQSTEDHPKADEHSADNAVADGSLKPLFIGKSLDSLLEQRLLRIVSLRLKHGFSWTGAELFFQNNQGKTSSSSDATFKEYHQPDSWANSTPKFLVADHMVEMDRNIQNLSFPLLAMQFTLRHFVKCTDFCLVCHCKLKDTFDALKPYVCSNGLCLYQYMELAMGPSLEYEIRSQPLVVELLIGLAYASATSGALEDFPTGLGLQVPANLLKTEPDTAFYTGQFDAFNLDLWPSVPLPARVGDWIVIRAGPDSSKNGEINDWHCRVEHMGETSGHIRVSRPIWQGQQLKTTHLPVKSKEVQFVIYDTSLDELEILEKQKMVSVILSTLPNIETMGLFIRNNGKNNLLSTWKQIISPAALDLLRWIVVSNRSFIKQDDQAAHKVTGMSDFIQFRLVQGAADKERRFINAVNSTSLVRNADHPTLFAWHGSPVFNWHGILHEGLHFKRVSHGRAYGDGVYMSNKFSTSMGYAVRHSLIWWPPTRLPVTTVISLNEVVNSPDNFLCNIPHYVVRQLDWIQPRYLFVKFQDTTAIANSVLQSSMIYKHIDVPIYYKQDQKHIALGPNGEAVNIPMSILSGQRGRTPRANLLEELPSPSKRRKFLIGDYEKHESDDDVSIATDVEDIKILLSDDESLTTTTVVQEAVPETASKTEYQPGSLQEDSLPTLSPPQFATTSATKILQQHLSATLKIQGQVPLHNLGWYVDHNLITTVYQWIVELHSFDSEIPLAQDLKTAKMQSIVLELRFPPRFPMDPPFVRVIRPRFLEFAHGGGGHVTAGGAMCMELLTQSGWLPTASIESVLLQVRMAILSPEPRPARLLLDPSRMEYSVSEAVDAYRRVSMAHGWKISNDIRQLAW